MKKNFFILLVTLMIVSLVAVIMVQAYWINAAFENKEEEFSLAVSQSLQSVSTKVQDLEISDYIAAYQQLIDSIGTPDESNFTDIFLFVDNEDDITSNLTSFYAFGILEEDYNISLTDINPDLGNENVKDYKKVKTTTILSKDKIFNRENRVATSITKLKSVERMSVFDQEIFRSAYLDYSSTIPVHKRIRTEELRLLLDREFKARNILTFYEFGIYNNGLATKVKSNEYIENQTGPKYETPIFTQDNGQTPFKLVVTFPDRDQFVFSSILSVAGLSIFLTLFIIIVSTTAIYQIIIQKKVSEMKSDFINNMSHEFKTPIATINLALDAISNPKTQGTKSRLLRYVKMIREENRRMLSQVENILMISRLEKSSSSIELSETDLHHAVEEALRRVDLIVKNQKGKIITQLNADQTRFKGNLNHFINLIVNLLDNAIKYSDGAPPEITVSTDNEDKMILLKIRDEGIGMDLNTQKYIFEKFFREQSGNIHNVKGHGLGLSYVKKIVELHDGDIKLTSKIGEGTTFVVSVPLL